ncbi:MAG: hypothetical protein EOO65_00430 [Methanosarcinales archaeon]|nr:MAG: hypothetical protein EOO65_00430 [Methanosarcinales archaeon]
MALQVKEELATVQAWPSTRGVQHASNRRASRGSGAVVRRTAVAAVPNRGESDERCSVPLWAQ